MILTLLKCWREGAGKGSLTADVGGSDGQVPEKVTGGEFLHSAQEGGESVASCTWLCSFSTGNARWFFSAALLSP